MGLLSGIRILDLSIMTAGPCGTQLLGDLGADIIKIEQPGTGDYSRNLGFAKIAGINTQFLSQNRNKRSVTLNLNDPVGRDIFLKLLLTADVVVENFRPGTVSKLGIDYQKLQKIKADIIYVSISAFGQTGPYSLLAANDPVVQAVGGLMAITGTSLGGPVRIGNPAPDFGAGVLMAAGMMAALLHRRRSGKGQKIEINLLDTALFSIVPMDGEYFATKESLPRHGASRRSFSPTDSFRTASGRCIYVSVFTDEEWFGLCQ